MQVHQTVYFLAAVLASTANAQVGEPLIGEELIDANSVYAFADAAIAEAHTIWSSDGWTVLSNTDGVLNEAKPVSGVFASANVSVTRATAEVDVAAQTLFDLLITPKGYQLIDPLSNPEDFGKDPLETFPTDNWRGSGDADKKRLEVARVEAFLPNLTTREFVVLNEIDALERIFVSKSVEHKGDPGCSIYGPDSCRGISSDPVRALNTFAVSTEPVEGDANKCTVRLINYADLSAPEVSAETMNQINLNFLPEMVERFRQHFATPT
ncbi:hypothetical protein Poli38472_007986 [Pythium oligandrum]|uniref:Uncharacterized protein n=1 Tax=Pythium oligandrum TaxID=41045 RepID=A0A8K1CLN5_PYTOL|nr:hypothetical protein Poli38472_007986 [Pythium oligandrum]|eukprot:TMW65344.1 hypothetical protein Poli38472_007986 [Pythium oligandrum]